jgi:spore maturation protein CgeB
VRVAIVYSYYPAYLREAYRQDPALGSLPYEEQHRALMARLFAQADAYGRGLGELGVAAVDLVMNAMPLQEQWMREHGGGSIMRRTASRVVRQLAGDSLDGIHRRLLQLKVVRAQIDHFRADVVLIHPLAAWGVRDLRALRRQGRLVVGQIASPLPSVTLLREFDLLLSSFPHFVERFRSIGIDSAYLRHFFYSRAAEAGAQTGGSIDASSERPIDLSFVGGLDPRTHPRRTAALEKICERQPVQVWGYGHEALPLDSAVRRAFRGPAWGRDMYRVLAQSKIALNGHIDVAEGYANNMRLYEATGMGALLLTEAAPNLVEQFEPGAEVATYRSIDELVDKAAYFLQHDDERVQVASAGQRRTRREHTERQRMRELIEILSPRLAG